ncbi:MAG: mevalonate kinase [Candidatus Thermoplasmatota archaeon]|nr:mevalonate kinase [Candidatus Thermoplasmatota archaeon]
MVTAFAPGKCILFGEHAVVYGEPAVAVSIDAGVEVTISESNKWILEGMPFEPSRHPHISHIINDIFQYRGNPLKIDIRSSLFSAAGLGSSAALSNSMGAALHQFTKPNEPLDLISLAKIGHSAEANAQQGRASPTDTATSALGGCIVVSGQKVRGTRHVFDATLETPEGSRSWSVCEAILPEIEDTWIVLGFTGIGSPTGKMVERVSELIGREPKKMDEIRAIGNITSSGLDSLSEGDMEGVGSAMNSCHERLRNLRVSCPELENLISAVESHSLGAKLTGAGGGGCMVSLTRHPKRVAECIEIAGGMPLVSKLGSGGARIL